MGGGKAEKEKKKTGRKNAAAYGAATQSGKKNAAERDERIVEETVLPRYDKKTWCKSALLGFFVGMAVVVPGISGSTAAIIFRLYDRLLYAIGNLFCRFRRCFVFLLPVGVGMLLGIFVGFIGVKRLLEILPFAVTGLFAGLMTGALPAVKEELKGAPLSAKQFALTAAGIALPVAVGLISVLLGATGGSAATGPGVGGAGFAAAEAAFGEVGWRQLLLCVPVGYVVGITQLAPGLSATAVLMTIGWFTALMEAVNPAYIVLNPAVLFVFGGLAIGFLAGVFTFSRALARIFRKSRRNAYCAIVGLSVGSIVAMFYNPDVFASVYAVWAKNGVFLPDLLSGAGLFAVGALGSYLLVRYRRKQDAERQKRS